MDKPKTPEKKVAECVALINASVEMGTALDRVLRRYNLYTTSQARAIGKGCNGQNVEFTIQRLKQATAAIRRAREEIEMIEDLDSVTKEDNNA